MTSTTTRAFSALAGCALGLLATYTTTHAQLPGGSVVVVPYGACGWRYIQPAGSYDEHALSQKTFNDSGWTPGCGPFVASWSCVGPGTVIPESNPILIRRHVFNATGHAVVARYDVKGLGGIAVHYNGLDGNGGGLGQECPPRFVVDGVWVLDPGDNVILVSGVSFVGSTGFLGGYLDAKISTDDVTSTLRGSWGQLKTLYR